MALLLLACPGEDPDNDPPPTSVGTITAGTTAPGTGTSSATTTETTGGMSGSTGTGPGPDSTGDSTEDDGPPGVFDIAGFPDLGGDPPPVMPTCDNLDMLGATSIGCEFWAAAVPGAGGGGGMGWGVSVGNPFDGIDVTVTIEDLRGAGGTLRMFHQFVLGPRQSQIIDMNSNAAGVMPGESHTVPAAGAGNNVAFRITADSPVTAMQISPIGGAPSFVPEASMLLPINALGQAYHGMGYGAGWVIVVATEDATTLNTDAGMQVLDAFDTYTFNPAGDPTGFFVGSDKPVAVFSGSSCTNIPAGAGWCDHIEEQVIPLAAWGTGYVAARHPHRQPMLNPTPEVVYWRVIAGTDNVTISVDPPGIVPGDQIALATAGDWTEVGSTENFVLTAAADKPFMLVQYMAGGSTVYPAQTCTPGPAVGDPNMMQMVPVAQWLTSLPFLTDDSYAMDFVLLAREAGAQVEVDCLGIVDPSHFTPIPGTPYEVGIVELDIDGMGGEGACVDGQQFVTASGPVGVMVGGYDCAASYGYPGGLSLDALWQPPTDPPG